MKTIKVSELQPGPQMDALVAEAQEYIQLGDFYWKDKHGNTVVDGAPYNPSGNGGQAMELVKEFDLGLWPGRDSPLGPYTHWCVCYSDVLRCDVKGETPEIAICRAVISSAFGEEVSLSDDNVASRFGETVEVGE